MFFSEILWFGVFGDYINMGNIIELPKQILQYISSNNIQITYHNITTITTETTFSDSL